MDHRTPSLQPTDGLVDFIGSHPLAAGGSSETCEKEIG